MITWGISAASHNAALAVFDNDRLVFASESERFSRVKNDPDLNSDLISYARNFGEPERICWYERPWLKTLRQLCAGQGLIANNVKGYLKKYGIRAPIRYSSHHHSHAAAGYYTSKFDDACVLVIDAIGEFETISIWRGRGKSLTKVYSQCYPHSIGLWYSAMTQRCGLKPNEEEYILMGMAALGDPQRLIEDIKKDFISPPYSRFFSLNENLHRGCLNWRSDLNTQQDVFDIAAATQKIYEELFDHILIYAKCLARSNNLVIMGGCALNCSANPQAFKYFDNVWIMPAPGDNGSSIGSVLAQHRQHIDWPGAYLGYDMGYRSSDDSIVDYLLKNKVCGIARGPAEFGPRALGNRSLVADPRGDQIKEQVNQIKYRELFRPFAPAILEELADQYFEMPVSASPYMQYVVKCRHPNLFPAIVHYDGTSRVQTVSREDNPRFRNLLETWYSKTGCPMLLNTSLNIKGQPMLNDHEDLKNWVQQYDLPVFN